MPEHDVLVIGGGSGLTATHFAEADGLDVGLVERGPLGGTCVNRGCIPTKTLIASAEVMDTIARAGEFGIDVRGEVAVDFPRILERMASMREDNVAHSDAWVEGSDHITLYRDEGRFVDDRTFEVDGQEVRGETVFVCAGASPTTPPIDGLEAIDHHTNRTVLYEMEDQPDRLGVVGGGYIGAELSHLFSSLGTDVTVVEAKTCMLREDVDVRSFFTERFGDYVDLYNGWTMTEVVEEDGELVCTVEEADGDETHEVVVDELLVATGRKPNTEDLGLETTGVETDEQGWIEVDDRLQTTHPDIYAYGDVIGQGMFKHTSSVEGRVAYDNSQGADEAMDYRANPHAVFTKPQIGGVGLTESEADEQGLDFRTERWEHTDVAKGEIIRGDGFAKAIVEEGSDRILGFHVCGPGAADLIHEVVVAMEAGDGTVENVTQAIHVHPTMSELVHSVFDAV